MDERIGVKVDYSDLKGLDAMFAKLDASEKKIIADFLRINQEASKMGPTVRKGASEADASLKGLMGTMTQMRNLVVIDLLASHARSFGEEVIGTTAKMEGLRKAIDFATGGQGKTVFKFLEEEAEKTGASLEALAVGFKTFSGAFIGTNIPLQQQLQMFRQVNTGIVAMNLSAEDSKGVFLALGQIMGKGKVMAEELRGQIGERIPGAFQIAARAMGVTTAQLDKMMQNGEVAAQDFLPKFAAEMERTFGEAVPAASNSLQAAINRQDNAWLQLKETIGHAIEPAFRSLIATTSEYAAILAKVISGEQLTLDESARLSATLGSLRNIVAIVLGLFLTMTSAGRALASGLLNVAGSVGKVAMAYGQMYAGSLSATDGVGRLKAATSGLSGALSGLGAALKGLGIGLVIALVLRLVEVFSKGDAAAERFSETVQHFNDALAEGMGGVDAEIDKLKKLFAVLKDANASEEDRARAIAKINAQYGEYLNGLNLETASLKEIALAEASVIQQMEKRLKLKVAQQIYEEELKKQATLTLALAQAQDRYNKAIAGINEAWNADLWTGISEGLKGIFGGGIIGEADSARDHLRMVNGELEATRHNLLLLESQNRKIDLLTGAPSAPSVSPSAAGGAGHGRGTSDFENQLQRLKERTAALNHELEVDQISSNAEREREEVRHNTAMELTQQEFIARRIAASDKLTAAEKAQYAQAFEQYKASLQARFLAEIKRIDENEVFAKVDAETQQKIFDVRQGFINGEIKSEEELQRQIARIELDGLQRKREILNSMGKSQVEINRQIQAAILKDTQARLAAEALLLRNANEAKLALLRAGGSEDQRRAIEQAFRMDTAAAGNDPGLKLQAELAKIKAMHDLDMQLADKQPTSSAAWLHTQYELQLAAIKEYFDKLEALYRANGRTTESLEQLRRNTEQRLEAAHIQKLIDLRQQQAQAAQQVVDKLIQIAQQRDQAEIDAFDRKSKVQGDALDAEGKRQALLAGDNAKKRQRVEELYAARKMALEKQQAKEREDLQKRQAQRDAALYAFQRVIAISMIALKTAQAVMATAAETGVFAPAAVIPIIALGAAEMAAVLLTPAQPPKFARGTLSVQGGRAGSDSVPAVLMPGEAVLPTAINRKHAGLVREVFHDTPFANFLSGRIRERSMAPIAFPIPHGARPTSQGAEEQAAARAERQQLLASNQELIATLRGLPVNHWHVDERGFTHRIQRGQQETIYLNDRA
jgi:tape measure domain-containing protein